MWGLNAVLPHAVSPEYAVKDKQYADYDHVLFLDVEKVRENKQYTHAQVECHHKRAPD